jgi:hypothetical protein
MVRLHIGDTCQSPLFEIPLAENFKKSHRDFNRSCNIFGVPELDVELAEKLHDDTQIKAAEKNILTCQ